jgi:sulfatase-like protein
MGYVGGYIIEFWSTGWPALILLAGFWYLGLCLLLGHRPIHGYWFIEQFLRETLFCLTLALLLPPAALLLCILALYAFTPAALVYQRVFGSPLSFTTLQYQWKEGAEAFSWQFLGIVPGVVVRASLIFGVEVVLLWECLQHPVSFGARYPMGLLCATGLTIVWAHSFNEVRRHMKGWASPAHLVPRYGYLVVWTFEYFWLRKEELLQEALSARTVKQDRLTLIEGPVALPGNLVLIQAESLAFVILQESVRGGEITPFLNRISGESMVFKIQAIHMNGSCDADFTLLHSRMPGQSVATYRIPHYPQQHTLPLKARACGMPMTFLHGQKGEMYNRRGVFKSMGFEDVLFSEEMKRSYETEATPRGGVPDHTVFEIAQRLLATGNGFKVQLIVTVSCHAPFGDLPRDFRSEFSVAPGDYDMRYFNSVRYFDGALEEFVGRTPDGTTFVIFGDHEPPGVAVGAPIAKGKRVEYVPGIVYQKGLNLASRQKTPKSFALSGELTMLDLATWIHSWFDTAIALRECDSAEPGQHPLSGVTTGAPRIVT